MANNYLQYSMLVELKSKAEADWLHTLLDMEVENRPAWARALLNQISDGDRDSDSEEGYVDGQFKIETKLDENGRFKTGSVWFYAEESAEPYNVGLILQAYLKEFHPRETLGFTWATTCSKMRLDEFSGGFVAISAKKILCEDAWTRKKKAEAKLLKAAKAK